MGNQTCTQKCITIFHGIHAIGIINEGPDGDKRFGGTCSPYDRKYRYCMTCKLFFKVEGRNCPCCRQHLRSGPKTKKRHQNIKRID